MFSLVCLLYFLAVMRVTRLINFDTIMDWLHIGIGRFFGPGSWQAEFAVCPWCVSMWVGLATAWAPLFAVGLPHWWLYLAIYVMLALAASMITGLFAPLFSEKTGVEPVDESQNPA